MLADGKSLPRGLFHRSGGHNLTVQRNIAVESGGFLAAEFGATVVDLGVVAMLEMLVPHKVMEYGSQVLGSYVVEPMLDKIDWLSNRTCKLQECKRDETVSREDRAKHIGRGIIVFGTAAAVSIGAKIMLRRVWNKHFDILESNPAPFTLKDANGNVGKWIGHHLRLDFMSPHEKMVFLADEGVHLSSLWLANNQLAPATDSLIRHTSDIVQKTTGLEKKKADDVAKMFAIWEVPNLVGTAAGIGMIAGAHAKGWPNGRIGEILANRPRTDASHLEKLAEERLAAFNRHTV